MTVQALALAAARQRNLNPPISEAQPGSPGRSDRTERSEPRSGAVDLPRFERVG